MRLPAVPSSLKSSSRSSNFSWRRNCTAQHSWRWKFPSPKKTGLTLGVAKQHFGVCFLFFLKEKLTHQIWIFFCYKILWNCKKSPVFSVPWFLPLPGVFLFFFSWVTKSLGLIPPIFLEQMQQCHQQEGWVPFSKIQVITNHAKWHAKNLWLVVSDHLNHYQWLWLISNLYHSQLQRFKWHAKKKPALKAMIHSFKLPANCPGFWIRPVLQDLSSSLTWRSSWDFFTEIVAVRGCFSFKGIAWNFVGDKTHPWFLTVSPENPPEGELGWRKLEKNNDSKNWRGKNLEMKYSLAKALPKLQESSGIMKPIDHKKSEEIFKRRLESHRDLWLSHLLGVLHLPSEGETGKQQETRLELSWLRNTETFKCLGWMWFPRLPRICHNKAHIRC